MTGTYKMDYTTLLPTFKKAVLSIIYNHVDNNHRGRGALKKKTKSQRGIHLRLRWKCMTYQSTKREVKYSYREQRAPTRSYVRG